MGAFGGGMAQPQNLAQPARAALIVATIVAFIALSALCANAQGAPQATGTVQGVVIAAEPKGTRAVVPGSKISLDGATHFETQSDGEGRFTFTAVPAGTYKITARWPG